MFCSRIIPEVKYRTVLSWIYFFFPAYHQFNWLQESSGEIRVEVNTD